MGREILTNPIEAVHLAPTIGSPLTFCFPPGILMRLTLRTLLAYMDDILDPQDQEDLAQQVTESEKASELIHRTRDAMRRLRLGAPPVLGEGMDLDPNATAEYLDNTMPADDMTEFQQVCLDSDVHLAEVASCHHILTMVLGEPAEIDPDMRQRMYKVPERVDEWRKLRVDSAHSMSGSDSGVAAAAVGAPQSDSKEEHPREVPDYLTAGEPSMVGRMALAFAAALLLGTGAFFAFGPDGFLVNNNQVADNAGEQAAAHAAGDNDAGDNDAAGDNAAVASQPNADNTPLPEVASDEAGAPATTDGSVAESAADEPGTGEPKSDTGMPAELPPVVGGLDSTAPVVDATETPAAGDGVSDGVTAEETMVDPLPPVGDVASGDVVNNDLTNDNVEIGDTTTDNADEAAMGAIAATVPTPGVGETPTPDAGAAIPDVNIPGVTGPAEMTDPATVADVTDSTSADSPAADATAATPERPAVTPLGTLVGLNQVLLRWDEEENAWLRLPPRSSIQTGYRLLSLPTYRPSLALVSGLRVEFSDGAMMTLNFADDGTTPQLNITYGRFLLQNTGMEKVEAELVVEGETTRVVIDSTAVLGFDVDRPFVAGADVEASVGSFVAKFYAPMGQVSWTQDGNSFTAVGPSQWLWADVEAASLTDEVQWLNGQSLDYLEQNLSSNIEKRFGTERPARQQLLGFYENSRRREEKSLAAVCGTHVGQFVPFVQALADTQQQSNWDEHIGQLRAAMSRSTDAARLVHQTLTEQRGAALADDLFEMLRGYTPDQIGRNAEQVKTGITRQLIDWLEHDRLEYRVLAMYNLRQIFGGKTLSYNPVKTEPSRQERAVRQWRQRLADNELTPQF